MYKLTKQGVKKCESFIAECKAKRKEILDAGIDTANDTTIPTVKDIECDLEQFVDNHGEYYNCWGVTDNHDSDEPICLKFGTDFVFNKK